MNPLRFSLRFPQVTWTVTAMLFAGGIYSLLTMPRREDPRITIRTGLVAAIYPGASAAQVEDQVTKKLEDLLFRAEEVNKVKTYSTSRDNVVTVVVRLEEWVENPDEFWAKFRHRLNELKVRDLPKEVIGPMVDADFGDTIAMLVAVHGERYGYRELRDFVRRIEDGLRTVPAVSKMRRFGEQKEQIVISSTLERVAQYGADPLQVIQALQARNVIQYAGALETRARKVPMSTTGLFQSVEQIRNLMVDVSRETGAPVYLGDMASVERRYADPDRTVRYNRQRAIFISVEMQPGNNIVEFGDEVREKLDAMRSLLPPDLQVNWIADQPRVVNERVTHFIREFFIAVAAVILVTILLLPFRVAMVAAVAIPVTIAVTFGIMHAAGIELHQVSIASLIIVLGMVVDDAIVIADNYVDLLDRKTPRDEAAWLCAAEMAIPVLTATLTIIASFLPLLLLTGSVGEFIAALPLTAAIAMASSFGVAMLLTPLLCRRFIRKGIKPVAGAGERRKRRGVLDLLETAYDVVIHLAIRRRAAILTIAVAAIVAGGFLLLEIPQRFFPSAERNQFVADVWLPEGTRVTATDAVLHRIEDSLEREPAVTSYATFLGASAPRFYYNLNPVTPADNYGQFLVNTNDAGGTPALVEKLRHTLALVAPEARVQVKELQQGPTIGAPVEIRVVGDDIMTLRRIGREIEDILRATPGSEFVHTDFHEDSFHLTVDIQEEIANRLGLNNSLISTLLAGAFSGLPVSTFWEGDREVEVVLRLPDDRRHNFDDVRNAYLFSPLTKARVPLREVADLRPEWKPARIVRRNGVHTLTVQSFFQAGGLASGILDAALPAIRKVPRPPGYHLEIGGESESQAETFTEMVRALLISLVAIFLILLFHFRSPVDSLIVMLSIPLALLGAATGLFLTGNPFGFTAFLGIIGLCGVVVRNSIILVDYMRERISAGDAVEAAAVEAGQRRLRPIFLTSMAAAVGVTPMILSGSTLWSPLASVLAVGLLFSMFFTLVAVPVVYVLAARGRPVAQEQ